MGGDCVTYPILYEANETDFFSLGLGPIKTATEAFVTEERNGSFILEGKVLVDDEIYPLLQENRIIKADASPTLTDQRFRIKRIVPNHDGQAEIYAEHVSYLSQELPMKPEVSISGNASAALNAWKSAILDDNPFIVDSDIGTSNKTNWRIDKVENPRQALGGVEGSILDVWGGEYRFDNYHISLLKKRGTTANTILAYGRNITDFEQERNIMTTYTTVYPFAIYTDDKEEERVVTIDGYVVDCDNIADYPNRNVLPVDFSNEFEHDEVPSKAKLKQLAQDYIKNNDIGIPKTSIKLSFLDLAQTADYADIAALETVELCDDVRVHYQKLGVDTTAKVIRTKWNVLRSAYDEIEIGEKRTTLSSIINDTQTSIKDIENQTGSAIIAANGKNMIFHGLFGEDGLGEPTATRVGDMWYKPNGENTEFYIWDGTVWAFIMSTAKFDEINNKVDELQTATEQAVENANNAVEQANQAVAKVDSMDKAINTALEQSANALDQAQQAIKDANDLLTTVTDVQGTVTNISAVVDEINNQLAVKVSQTDFDKLKGTVDTQTVQISANAKEISLKASQSSVDTITDNVTSIQSELKTQAGSITAINSRVDGQQTQIGTLQSSYSGLSSTIANVQNDFDNLQLGGRNLLLQSSVADRTVISSNDSSKYPIVKTNMTEGSRNFVRVKRSNPTTNPTVLSLFSTLSFTLLSEDIRNAGAITISFCARTQVPSKWSCMAYYYYPQTNAPRKKDLEIGTQWKRFSITFDSIPSEASALRFNPQQVVMGSSVNMTDFYLDICEYKVEKGNKATDWTPAPEDMATITEMSNITQTIKDIQLTVANKVSQAQFTILSNQVTTTVSDIADLVNKFPDPDFKKQNPKPTVEGTGIQIVYDSQGMTINNNGGTTKNRAYWGSPPLSLEIGKSYNIKMFVNVGASSGGKPIEVGTGEGENFTFSLPDTNPVWISGTIKLTKWTGLSFWLPPASAVKIRKLYIYEANTNVTSSQITQLSDSINLRVSKNDVVNQINISTEGVLIAGKKIQITGETYIENGVIKSAQIADGAITNAKIANATISSAKIISLDASKITANDLSVITANTGTLNVTGWINVTTDNRGIRGTYDFGDGYGEAFNYRWFEGDYRLSHRHLVYTGKIYNVNSNNTRGSYLYDGETFFGNDYLKMRQYNSSGTLLNRTDINANQITMSEGNWGNDSTVVLRSDGTSYLGGNMIINGEIEMTGGRSLNTTYINSASAGANINLNAHRTDLADFRVGKDGSSINGGRVVLSKAVYNRTYSNAANMVVTVDGVIGRSTSARKYKADITTAKEVIDKAKNVLNINPSSWYDKGELADGIARNRYYGFIADQFDECGLKEVVIYGADGQVESLAYDRITMYHNVILTEHEKEINRLKKQVATLENQVRVLQAA